MNSKLPLYLLLLLSFLGFLDATYLSLKYYLASPVSCSFLNGCERVISSDYGTVGPIPLSLFGVFYYLVLVVLVLYFFDTKNEKAVVLAARLTVIGFLVSLYLVGIQIFVIKALCFYCLLSAITSILLFFCGMLYLRPRSTKLKSE